MTNTFNQIEDIAVAEHSAYSLLEAVANILEVELDTYYNESYDSMEAEYTNEDGEIIGRILVAPNDIAHDYLERYTEVSEPECILDLTTDEVIFTVYTERTEERFTHATLSDAELVAETF